MLETFIIALVVALAGVDYFMEVFQLYRPLVLGTIIGFIMGDVLTGMLIGGTFELMWLGLMPIGGAQPPNMVIGTALGTTFAIATNTGAATAIGIGVPFAILMQGGITMLYTVYAFFMKKSDQYAENGQIMHINRIQYGALGIVFVIYFLVTFLPIYFGIDHAKFLISLLPETLIKGLTIAGGMLPAIGFAMLLNIMFKIDYLIFLVIGFVMAVYLKLPIIAIAIIAVCIAIYDFSIRNSNNNSSSTKNNNNGI